jgi:hypothetical protein
MMHGRGLHFAARDGESFAHGGDQLLDDIPLIDHLASNLTSALGIEMLLRHEQGEAIL